MMRIESEEQFKLSPEAYLRKHHILTYLEDALSQLSLQEQPPRCQSDSARFMTGYLNSVLSGTHVLFRDFCFIMSTPLNRICFINTVHRAYHSLLQSTQSLTVQEIHSLLLLLCNDLPIELVQRAVLNSGNSLMQPILFSNFLQAFQLQCYLDEFLTDAIKIYRTLQGSTNHVNSSSASTGGPDGQTTPRRAQNVVVVPGANDAVSTVGSGGVGEEPSSTAVASAPQSEEISTEANLKVTTKATSTNIGSGDFVETFAFKDRLKQSVTSTKGHQPMPSAQTIDECLSCSETGPRIKFSHFFLRLASAPQLKSLFVVHENTPSVASAPKEGSSSKKKFTVVNSDQ